MKKYQSLQLVKKQTYRTNPKLSLGIRVKNEIEAIKYFWDSVKKQTYIEHLEIVFLDSGSTDGTVDFIKDINCNLYTIEPAEFSFGETCNLIMELSTCDYVCFFSGHVILESEKLLEYVIGFFQQNSSVSGYFRQTPNYKIGCTIYDSTFLKYKYAVHPDKDPILITNEKNGFSNAASLVCRKHWEHVKFRDVIASEDHFWAKEVIESNMKVYYFHMLNVQHSHKETLDNIYKRVRINAKSRYPDGVGSIQIFMIFIKVFFALFFNSYNIIDSLKYANIHSSAYKNLSKI